MSNEEKKAIEHLKNYPINWELTYEVNQIAIDVVLNLIKKLQEENDILQTNYEILQGEMDRIGISILGLEAGNSTDDVIDEIKKLQKELEQEKEKNKQFKDIEQQICNEVLIDTSSKEFMEKHIPKYKIRAKIQYLEKLEFGDDLVSQWLANATTINILK